MDQIDYVRPRSLADAYAAMSDGKQTTMLAGGTDIIVQLREGRRHTDQVLDLKRIPELMQLTLGNDGSLIIGAATPCAEIYEHPAIAKRFPALIDSASLIGGIQIQGRASLGGNVCNASPAADGAPSLIALGALAVLGSREGQRELPIEDFFVAPGKSALRPGEILLQLKIPAQPERSSSFFNRFIPRNEMDIAVANAAARIALSADGSTVEDARIAVGAVAPTPLIAVRAAELLRGKPATTESFEQAAAAAAELANPITDMRGSIAQRRHLARVLTLRALEGANSRAKEAR